MEFSIFVRDDYLGSFHYTPANYIARGWYSTALCCADCGDIWARVVCPEHPFYFQPTACQEHGSILDDCGSLVNSTALLMFRAVWPLSVWQREAELWLQVADWRSVPNDTGFQLEPALVSRWV